MNGGGDRHRSHHLPGDGIVGPGLASEHGELVEAVVGRGLGRRGGIDGGGVGGLGDRADEVLRRAGEGEGRELADGEPDIGDTRETPIPSVVEIAKSGGQRAAGELSGGDLVGLAEIAQREGAEVAGAAGEAADGVVLEGLGAGTGDGAAAQAAQFVIGRGDGAGGQGAALLLELQRAQRARRD